VSYIRTNGGKFPIVSGLLLSPIARKLGCVRSRKNADRD